MNAAIDGSVKGTRAVADVTDPRPCPFCWAFGADLSPEEITPGVWAVCCTECGAQGPSNHLVDKTEQNKDMNATRDQAITEWNTRA